MIIVVVAFEVTEGSTAAFEGLISELSAASLADEPGTLTYELGRSESEAGHYRLVEIYQDRAAFDAHVASPRLKEAGERMRDLLKGKPDIQRFVSVRNPE